MDTHKRGFAGWDKEKLRDLARQGGSSVPLESRSFYKNRELASAAGKKGGNGVAKENRSFSRNRELAIAAGRKGGEVSQARRRAAMKEAKCDT